MEILTWAQRKNNCPDPICFRCFESDFRFSMNVFKNKKNVGKIKKTLKNVKKRALNKNVKTFFLHLCRPMGGGVVKSKK